MGKVGDLQKPSIVNNIRNITPKELYTKQASHRYLFQPVFRLVSFFLTCLVCFLVFFSSRCFSFIFMFTWWCWWDEVGSPY